MTPDPSPVVSTAFAGWVRADADNVLRGWALDRSEPDRRLEVEIHIDRKPVVSLIADRFDPMLRTMDRGDGRHGFALAIPSPFRDGLPHRFHVVVHGSGERLGNDHRSFQVWDGPAVPQIEILRAGYGGVEGLVQGGPFSAATRFELWNEGRRLTDPLETVWFGQRQFLVRLAPRLAKLTRLPNLMLAAPGMMEGGFAGAFFHASPGGLQADPPPAPRKVKDAGPPAPHSPRLRAINISLSPLDAFNKEVIRLGGSVTRWERLDPLARDRIITHRPPILLNRERLGAKALGQWAHAYGADLFVPRKLDRDTVFSLPDALMVPQTLAVLTATHNVLTASYRNPKCFQNFARQPSYHDATMTVFRNTEMLDGAVATVGPMEFRNFYHWMTEGLPRAHMLRTAVKKPFRILIPEASPRYVTRSLEMIGFTADDLIAAGRKNYRCEHALFATTPGRSVVLLMPWMFDFYRRLAEDHADLPVPGIGEDILITRAGAHSRRLVNEAELLQRLGPGFVPVQLEALPLPEQIAVMRRARRIVAPHGAGLTLLLVADPSARIVELQPDSLRSASSYWAISDQRDLHYAAALGHAHDVENHNSDFALDAGTIEDVAAFLCA